MDFSAVTQNLEAMGFRVSCFDSGAEAAASLCQRIRGRTVGFGGSMTLRELGLFEKLSEHNEVFWHWTPPEGKTPEDMRRAAALAQVYLTSANALAETGEIINIDGTGNRVAAAVYGHETVYYLIGENKLAPDYESALYRARNIAGPRNAARVGAKTPCAAKADRCYDCRAPGRICRALSVLWTPMMGMDCEILLIHETLGY